MPESGYWTSPCGKRPISRILGVFGAGNLLTSRKELRMLPIRRPPFRSRLMFKLAKWLQCCRDLYMHRRRHSRQP